MIKTHDGDPDRVAIICPGGGGYSPDWPLLYYTREVLLARGWSLRELWWTPPAEHARATGAAIPGATAWVREQVTEVLAGVTLIVGKSLGTLALPVAVERSLPGIWLLTPRPVRGRRDTWPAAHPSKNPSGAVLTFTPAEWDAFLDGARTGEFDRA